MYIHRKRDMGKEWTTPSQQYGLSIKIRRQQVEKVRQSEAAIWPLSTICKTKNLDIFRKADKSSCRLDKSRSNSEGERNRGKYEE